MIFGGAPRRELDAKQSGALAFSIANEARSTDAVRRGCTIFALNSIGGVRFAFFDSRRARPESDDPKPSV
jgi:hypothetical protein